MQGDQKQEFLKCKEEYIRARVLYESLRKLASNLHKPINDDLDSGRISEKEWAERTSEIDFDIGVDLAYDRLVVAENRLIECGRKLLETIMTHEESEKLKRLWECKYPSVRSKVVDLLIRWEPD